MLQTTANLGGKQHNTVAWKQYVSDQLQKWEKSLPHAKKASWCKEGSLSFPDPPWRNASFHLSCFTFALQKARGTQPAESRGVRHPLWMVQGKQRALFRPTCKGISVFKRTCPLFYNKFLYLPFSTVLHSYRQCSLLHIAVPNSDTTRLKLFSTLHTCNSTPACPGSGQPLPAQSHSGSHLSSSCPSTQLPYFCPRHADPAQLSWRACCLQCWEIRAALSVRTSTRAVPWPLSNVEYLHRCWVHWKWFHNPSIFLPGLWRTKRPTKRKTGPGRKREVLQRSVQKEESRRGRKETIYLLVTESEL